MHIPSSLIQSLETGEAVLFLGAGIGFHLQNREGKRAPTGAELSAELIAKFDYPYNVDEQPPELSLVAEYVVATHSRAELDRFLVNRFADFQVDEVLGWLLSLKWRAIYTTNYDYSLVKAFDQMPNPLKTPVIYDFTPSLRNFETLTQFPLVYLHGTCFGERPYPLITEEDYIVFREKRQMLFEMLKNDFLRSTLLYIGYSHNDSDWKIVFNEVSREFSPNPMPISYRLAPNTPKGQLEILKLRNVITLEGRLQDFYVSLTSDSDTAEAIRKPSYRPNESIPSKLSAIYVESAAATTRLLNSWDFLNEADVSSAPNFEQFIRGDRPNWPLIHSDLAFERDLEAEIFERYIEFATSNAKTPQAHLVLAPAGFGTTTLLLRLGKKLITEGNFTVFYLKYGNTLLSGDIEFAAKIFPDNPTVFIIDNASTYHNEIEAVVNRLTNLKIPAFFILGSRLNEWRQVRPNLRCIEIKLEALSNNEITKLISLLKTRNSLGFLTPLSDPLRFEAIKSRFQHQLLVTLRELIDNQTFHSIIDSEYRQIVDDKARQAYLVVSCFHQLGVSVRLGLLIKILEISLSDYLDLELDGILITETFDANRGIETIRTRHRTIAEIIWERCGTSDLKDNILSNILKNINVDYSQDRIAFERITRNDELIDSVGAIEARLRLFEQASRKDPHNPHILQHYARAALRANLYKIALHQIDAAIKMENRRIFLHTKGVILRAIALTEENLDVARRYFLQSEDCFRRCIKISPKDEYGYHGLAHTYFEWAKFIARKPNGLTESNEYLLRSETEITAGLQQAKYRETLYILSADLQRFVGNSPQQIQALVNAVREAPVSATPRYLLARAYRSNNQISEALDILKPIITFGQIDVRAVIEYAQTLVETGGSYSDAIIALRSVGNSGNRSNRYLATLGGMYYLNKNFQDAKQTFNEVERQQFTIDELNSIEFIPKAPSDYAKQLVVSGIVRYAASTYALISVTGYEDAICPASKYGDLILEQGMRISANLAFRAKGAILLQPQSDNS